MAFPLTLTRAGLYEAPDGRYTATYAPLWRRGAAAALDWGLCLAAVLVVSIPAGAIQAVGTVSADEGVISGTLGQVVFYLGVALALAPVVAYFAAYWTTAQTLGMRAVDIHTVVTATGRAPRVTRSLPRAAISLVFALATYNAVSVAIGRPLSAAGYTDWERIVIAVSQALFAIAIATKLWILVDGRRQSWQDKLFGQVVVEELVPMRPQPSPWGLLDQVDVGPR